jgi:site-specific recombinase XerD
MFCVMYRNLVLEFGTKALGIGYEDVQSTLAYRLHQQTAEDKLLFQARVLAYAASTWANYASTIQEFVTFCSRRELNIFECTPYIVNLFLLAMGQNGSSFRSLQKYVAAISFVFRFFLAVDPTQDQMVTDVLKFLKKVVSHNTRVKDGFGSAEIRKLWNCLEEKFGTVSNWPNAELRTFVMIVLQHGTFCRFSDIRNVKLSDLIHDVDYFQINIRYSKTDQAGLGQTVYLPNVHSMGHNAHMLMCLYLQRIDVLNTEPDCYIFPPLK